MRTIECVREQDVLDALAARRWPARCDGELVAHIAQCSICADMIAVVQPIGDAHEELWPSVQVPSASTVWWRAQLRARQEAARRVARPITIVQAAAVVAALAVAAALAYIAAPLLPALSFSLPALPAWFSLPDIPAVDFSLPQMPPLTELGLWWRITIGVLLTWGVIAPLAIYFAISEE